MGDIFACLSMAQQVRFSHLYGFNGGSAPHSWRCWTIPVRSPCHSVTLFHLKISSEDFSEKRETTRFFFRFPLLGLWGTTFRFRLFCLGLPSPVRVGSAPCLSDGKVVATALMNELHSVQLGWTGRGDTPRSFLWCRRGALHYYYYASACMI